MPINQLLYDHQIALLKSQHGAPAVLVTLAQAEVFAKRIATWRGDNALPTVGWPGHQQAETPAGKKT